MLILSGCIIYYCSYTSTNLKMRYPKTICENTDKLFLDKDAKYELKAFQEYLHNE